MGIMTYIKAILAGASAGVSGLITGFTDGHLTAVEGLVALYAALAAAGVVYGIPNRQK